MNLILPQRHQETQSFVIPFVALCVSVGKGAHYLIVEGALLSLKGTKKHKVLWFPLWHFVSQWEKEPII